MTGAEKSLDVVVEIFNRVNSGGTKAIEGRSGIGEDLRRVARRTEPDEGKAEGMEDAGYYFNLDWLLRSVNTVLTGEARFAHLHNKTAPEIEDGLARACRQIDASLDLIAGRIGLDHDRVLFGRFGVPVMVRYMDRRAGPMDAEESDKLLFWFAQAGMWDRFSGSTETIIDQDLAALEGPEGGLDALIEPAPPVAGRTPRGSGPFRRLEPGRAVLSGALHADPHGRSERLGSGLALKAHLLGRMARLEVHHIFPKSRLYAVDYERPEVNAVANFCFLTKETNLVIGSRFPEDYFAEVETNHPGALASQWIPMEPALWRIERYRDFLEARKALLAAEANRYLADLLHGDSRWLSAAGTQTGTDPDCTRRDRQRGRGSRARNAQRLARRTRPAARASCLRPRRSRDRRADGGVDLAWPDGLSPG